LPTSEGVRSAPGPWWELCPQTPVKDLHYRAGMHLLDLAFPASGSASVDNIKKIPRHVTQLISVHKNHIFTDTVYKIILVNTNKTFRIHNVIKNIHQK